MAAAVETSGNAGASPVDFKALRDYRIGRVRAAMAEAGVGLAILASPVSMQYAADFDGYQLYQSRIPTFTLMVSLEGDVTLCGAYGDDYPGVDTVVPSFHLSHFDAGLDMTANARRFATFLRDMHPAGERVAVERLDASTVHALVEAGFDPVDAGGLMEKARSIKSMDEVTLILHALDVASEGVAAMRATLRPGVSENELWSHLHRVNIARGGRWIDGRMLASGPRTNPWLQEATDRVIEAGDMVSFDTDMVGPFGYFADMSRAWVCGDEPSPAQRDLYRRAVDEIEHNITLVRPDLSFRDYAEAAFRQPGRFLAHRYPCLAHGAGMSDEWPKIAHLQDWDHAGYDGVIEAGMVLCIESFVGDEHGGEGVKLEQQVLVTESGCSILSKEPWEQAFLT